MKTKSILFIAILILSCHLSPGQGVAVNETGSPAHLSAMLHIQSTSKGILIPSMTTAQRTTIAGPENGLLVFDNTTSSFWFFSNTSWVELAESGSNEWQSNGSNLYFNSGNVGIDDNTPLAALTVGNGDKFQVEATRGNVTFTDPLASLKFPSTNSTNNPMLYMFSSGTQNADRMVIGHSPSFPQWGIEYDDTLDAFHFRSSATRHISIRLNSGRLGIGTENPLFPFEMIGRARLVWNESTPAQGPGIWFTNRNRTFDRTMIGMSEPDSILGIWSQHMNKWAIEFELMREPRIGINIRPGSPPRSEVHLYHTNFGGSNDGVRIQNEGANSHYWNLYTSNSTGDFEFYKQGIKRATVNPASGAWTAVSDARFKKNINDLDPVLTKVMELRAATYQYTDVPDQRYFIGFLAQELEMVFPQFVSYGGDNQITYTVDYGGLSVIALKAIQEQQAQIEMLKEEIGRLKEEIGAAGR